MPALGSLAWSVVAVLLAWAGGLGVVALTWPRRVALPWCAWSGLGGFVGPGVAGLGLMVCGVSLGPSTAARLWLAGLLAALFVAGVLRRRRLPAAGPTRREVAVGLVLTLALAWTVSLSLRTHLGWDGTVVWYHKARVLAATGGVMPLATLADRTRGWTAPDYPLQVPLAMAWVRTWQPEEDERAIKVLPAAWCAALLCLLVAAIRTHPSAGTALHAGCALLLVAGTSRLLVGDGSLTSGYGDGPVAGLLLALAWLAWRSDWGAERAWTPLMALVAVLLAWTKQEGLVAVLAVAIAIALRGERGTALRVGAPAVLVSVSWAAWAALAGAPTGIAYEWQGAEVVLGRIVPIVVAYGAEATDWPVWGAFWPAVTAGALWAARSGRTWRVLAVVTVVAVTGASAFLLSDWPDIRAHLAVTVPRQLIQLAPTLIWCACVPGRHAH